VVAVSFSESFYPKLPCPLNRKSLKKIIFNAPKMCAMVESMVNKLWLREHLGKSYWKL
jgi:hypothetical protein